MSRDPHVEESIHSAVSHETFAAATNRIDKLEAVLRQIVDEYSNTYDADCKGGHWTAAASIPVEVMERARSLLT